MRRTDSRTLRHQRSARQRRHPTCKDATAPDRDGDGYDRPADCRDDDPAIHPDAHDVPRDSIDEDCDQADADYPPIRSDIRHAERGVGAATIIRGLSVTRPPTGARVLVRCQGRGCPLRRRVVTAAPGTGAVARTGLFRHARLQPRTRVDIAVTAPATYGKMLRLTMRRGAPPKLAWLKIDPDSMRVSPW